MTQFEINSIASLPQVIRQNGLLAVECFIRHYGGQASITAVLEVFEECFQELNTLSGTVQGLEALKRHPLFIEANALKTAGKSIFKNR